MVVGADSVVMAMQIRPQYLNSNSPSLVLSNDDSYQVNYGAGDDVSLAEVQSWFDRQL
jgi:hypothetical protein